MTHDDAPRRRVRRLTIFFAIAAVQFGIFETALRVWGSSEAAPAFQGLFARDPDLGFRLKPGARTRYRTAEFDTDIAVNNAGVRDNEDLGPKAPDERRIVMLGDSLVLSVQVPFEQTFGELLEARLNSRRDGYRYRVINAGVQGYGPVHEREFFRKTAATLAPDIVLTSIFVGNDAEEAYNNRFGLRPAEQPGVESLRQRILTPLRRLVRNSMVLQILRLRMTAATDRFTTRLAPPEPPLQSYAASPAPRIAEGIRIARDCVRDIAAHAAQLGAKTGVILMPARFQVDDGDYGRLKEIVRSTGGELVRDAATGRFEAAFAELALPRVDPLPELRAAARGPDLFFQQNVHLTPRGHEILAGVLERFLDESGLLKAPEPSAAR